MCTIPPRPFRLQMIARLYSPLFSTGSALENMKTRPTDIRAASRRHCGRACARSAVSSARSTRCWRKIATARNPKSLVSARRGISRCQKSSFNPHRALYRARAKPDRSKSQIAPAFDGVAALRRVRAADGAGNACFKGNAYGLAPVQNRRHPGAPPRPLRAGSLEAKSKRSRKKRTSRISKSVAATPFSTVVIDAGHGGFDRGGIRQNLIPKRTWPSMSR